MKPTTRGTGLKVNFLPCKSGGEYRCVTGIRTKNEKCWGFVYRDPSDRNRWTNSSGDGREYSSRTLAGRGLVERHGL